MRGVLCVLFLLVVAPVLAEELNTTEYVGGDEFTLDGTRVQILSTWVNRTHIRIAGDNQIIEEEECFVTTYHKVCLDESENESADITFWKRNFNVSLTRDIVEAVNISDEFDVSLVITNNAEDRLRYQIVELTNATNIFDIKSFNNELFWRGWLNPGESKKLKYTVIAEHIGEYYFNASVIGKYTTAENSSVEVEDFLAVKATYEWNATEKQEYNFSFTVENELSEEVFTRTSFNIPDGVKITDIGNITRLPEFHAKRTLNGSESARLWFTYIVEDLSHTNLTIDIEAEVNGSESLRRYSYDLTKSSFSRLVILHDHYNKELKKDITATLPIQIFNPNPFVMRADILLTSVLVSLERTISIPARNSTIVNAVVTPNISTSEYNLDVLIEYESPDDEELFEKDSFRLFVEQPKPNLTNETNKSDEVFEFKPELFAIVQDKADAEEPVNLMVRSVGISALDARMVIYRNGDVFINESLDSFNSDSEIIRTLIGPGVYFINIRYGDSTINTTTIISEREPVVVVTEDEPIPSWYFVTPAIIIGILIAWFATGKTRRTNKMKRLEKELHHDIVMQENERRFVNSFHPHTPADTELKENLLEELDKHQKQITKKQLQLDRLKKHKR